MGPLKMRFCVSSCGLRASIINAPLLAPSGSKRIRVLIPPRTASVCSNQIRFHQWTWNGTLGSSGFRSSRLRSFLLAALRSVSCSQPYRRQNKIICCFADATKHAGAWILVSRLQLLTPHLNALYFANREQSNPRELQKLRQFRHQSRCRNVRRKRP